MLPEVDVLVLTRDGSSPREEVRRALATQQGVLTRLHVVPGTPLPDDPNRWATIARARNAARTLGQARFVLFLDDDVVLEPDCLSALVTGLSRNPDHAALAADYLGESIDGLPSRHVAMGATLFRREVLEFLRFRWEDGRCECQCACDDLRDNGFGIAYELSAVARHQPRARRECRASVPERIAEPLVLSAFDGNHHRTFHRQFLASLRAAGNLGTVGVLGYGLDPSAGRLLAGSESVEPVLLAENGVHPAIRRLRDFPTLLERWPSETPAAYWDAGDVIFQSSLGPLWDMVRTHPDKLLVAREPLHHPQNRAVASWTLSIHNPDSRRRVFDLLTTNPFLNAGFAAGTAGTLTRYFREADRFVHSKALAGSSDWGDQTAMNLYCHSDPTRYQEVSDRWNFCLHNRDPNSYELTEDGRIRAGDGRAIHVVHGNASSLRKLDLAHVWD